MNSFQLQIVIEKRQSNLSYLNFHPYGGWLCAVSETRRTYLGSGVTVNETRNIGSGSRGHVFAAVFQ